MRLAPTCPPSFFWPSSESTPPSVWGSPLGAERQLLRIPKSLLLWAYFLDPHSWWFCSHGPSPQVGAEWSGPFHSGANFQSQEPLWVTLVCAAQGFLLWAFWKHRSHGVDVIRAIVLTWLHLGPSRRPVGIQMEWEE